MSENTAETYELPPTQNKRNGELRRVGFELEFSGIDLAQTVAALRSVLDAKVCAETEAEVELDVDALGKFNIEIDWAYLKSKAAQQSGRERGHEWLELLSQAAALLVPVEVVCPPIAISRLDALTPMVNSLRRAGAVGTQESFISAYGVHVNPEIPDLDAATLSAYLRAYALLQWWLVDTYKVNIARRISPYIDLYSDAYLEQLLSYPDAGMDQIFSDYLEHNPSRNRALDLLPLLAEIDEERVRSVVDDARIKARPTFHYRLPDCHIEQSDWSLEVPWRSWLTVEKLASRPDDLEKLGHDFLASERPILDVKRKTWVDHIDKWLNDQELV